MKAKKYTQEQESRYIWESLCLIWPEEPRSSEITLNEEIEEIETHRIRLALDNNGHNRTHAAKQLGIGRTNLIAKCKKLGIDLKQIA